jgi:hypothetical protein
VFQEVEAPRIYTKSHTKMLTLSALGSGRLYSQQISLVLISIRDTVDSNATVWPEELKKNEEFE